MTNEQNEQIMQAIKELHTQMNGGFEKIDKRFVEMHDEMNTRFGEVDKRFDNMDENIARLQDGVDLLAKKTFDNETDIYRIKKSVNQA